MLKTLTSGTGEKELLSYVRTLLRAFSQEGKPAVSEPFTLVEPLTPRELEVLRFLADGASNQEIADHLIITLATVKKHVGNVLSKLGARSRADAVARAHAQRLLDDQ